MRARLIAIMLPLALAATSFNAGPARASLSSWILSAYPTQARATQGTALSTRKWALLIGINDYVAPTADNIGARQDAQSIETTLVHLGWRTDHIILLTDLNATAQHIIDGIRWLAYKTRSNSTVVFHYSGHENYRWVSSGSDSDRDTRDVMIWAANNRYITDDTLGYELNHVVAYHMWIDISTCRASGFDDYGMIKPGRILTYSSTVNELSYEDPYSHHSVFTWWEVILGMYDKKADTNHDGKVTVEEAFWWSKPHVTYYTSSRQHPVIVDRVTGNMYL